ncbi:MAG: hypothetical protein U5K38_12260 [Woeseiaceae bacterium]|nr:hypothetical protein [Woeseiaceae bacterium]
MHDLRRGSIAVSIGVENLRNVSGPVLGERELLRPLLATAMLPLAIGIAYLILSRLDKQKEET